MSWQRVCAVSELPTDGALGVEVGGQAVAVARVGGELFAVDDLCSHAEVALSEGDVEIVDGVPVIECWLHGSAFDLRSGAPTNLPATEPVTVHPVRVEGDDVLVDAPATAS